MTVQAGFDVWLGHTYWQREVSKVLAVSIENDELPDFQGFLPKVPKAAIEHWCQKASKWLGRS